MNPLLLIDIRRCKQMMEVKIEYINRGTNEILLNYSIIQKFIK